MKNLTLIVLRPPLMAAHALVLLAGRPGSAHAPEAMPAERRADQIAAIARARAACGDDEQVVRIRQALPNTDRRTRARLLADPLGQIETFGTALRLDPDSAGAHRHDPSGPCRFTVSFGRETVGAAGLARLADLADRAQPIGSALVTRIWDTLIQGQGDPVAVGRLTDALHHATGQICVGVADLDRIAPRLDAAA